jgi:mono/diheme cytochrome c family protein
LKARALLLAVLAAGLAAGCRQDMHDNPRLETYERSDVFADGLASRPLEEGTVARGQLRADDELETGKVGTAFAAAFPAPVTVEVLRRGQNRYQIYCTPCHGQLGKGDGMVVRRGLKQPPSFHEERLRQQAPGYVYDVITNGFGVMPDYRAQVPSVEDRWAIVAYVKALQLSQNATLADVPEAERVKLGGPGAAGRQPEAGTLPSVIEGNQLEEMRRGGATREHHP